jgi:hypothetical protein
MKIELKPTDDIKKWYRFWSLRLAAFGALLMALIAAWPESVATIWANMPDETKLVLPERVLPIISLIIFVLTAASRLVKQNINDKAKEDSE